MADINEMINIPVDIEPVSFDYEKAKDRLTEMLEPYKGLIVTEDNYKLCKEKKDEVGRISKELDETRKAIKKAYEKPLKDFERDIKSLVAMTDRVKKEISKQLDVFDDKRRDEKKQIAESIMEEVIAEYGLNEKYAGQIEFRKSYANLTAKEADVRADVEAQCMALKQQQENEESVKKAIINAVTLQNENIVAKMTPNMYITLIGKLPTDEIISRIIKRGDEIRKLEAEAMRDKKSELKQEMEQDIQDEIKTSESVAQEPETVSTEQQDTTLYRVTFVITGTEAAQKALSRFLKENRYNYSVENQIILE